MLPFINASSHDILQIAICTATFGIFALIILVECHVLLFVLAILACVVATTLISVCYMAGLNDIRQDPDRAPVFTSDFTEILCKMWSYRKRRSVTHNYNSGTTCQHLSNRTFFPCLYSLI